MDSLFTLENKVILITGGYGYLGSAITAGLAQYGAIVYVLGRDKKKFNKAFCDNSLPEIKFCSVDISETDSIKEGFRKIFDMEGKIDVLINNAFYSKGQIPEQLTDEEWSFGIDGSLSSVFRCIREVIPYYKIARKGKIINVASMYGMVSPDFSVYKNAPQLLNPPHYGASKAGVIQLTKYYASYLGKLGVTVNVVSPGPFPNESVQTNESFVEALKSKNPCHKIGKPEDLKGAFIFLSSNASDYVNGHNLVVDGGWTIL